MSSRKPTSPSFPRSLRKPAAVVGAAIALGGGTYGIVAATASNGSTTAATARATTTTARQSIPGKGGSNARSGPAAGGAVGTVVSVSKSSFTLTTPAGQKVTVDEASSTRYQKGTSSIPAGAITKGERVLVLGTTSGTTIRATQAIVQAGETSGSTTSSAVVPFQRGAPSTAKQAGEIPANYSEGSGTIVGGTTANRATEAALVAYPGGVVDRVVKLSNGDYEVHNIGVNWPHHIFVSKNFKVVGAD
jgi:hypothetical protein